MQFPLRRFYIGMTYRLYDLLPTTKKLMTDEQQPQFYRAEYDTGFKTGESSLRNQVFTSSRMIGEQ